MNIANFLSLIEKENEPFGDLSSPLQALWWAKKGYWENAHELAQSAGSVQGDWVHAYLHREEGDLGNAAYWYARAGKPVCSSSLSVEWEEMVKELLK